MTLVKLPEVLRPRNVYYKPCALGVDLPASFFYGLKGIDDHLYPVYHKFKVLYESTVTNDYAGALEDPRYEINNKYGYLNFGFVLTDGKGAPSPDGHWHVWRLCRPHGWAHIFDIQTKDQVYLNRFLHLLWLQGQFNDKFKHKGYSKMLEELDIEKRKKLQDEQQEMFDAIQDANGALLSRAKQNMMSGVMNKPAPQKDIIVSGAGLSKRGKITRDATDEEGGLVTLK